MKNRIQVLPDDLISRIAAGEVVERPASVLKELVENSLDAGAKTISVKIEGAGRTKIQVSDDGCGMTKEEAILSLKRHATSKISAYEDLEEIGTFGFRGEALPSIASVSKFNLVTRTPAENTGWEFKWEGGKLTAETPCSREAGTTITVSDLFFNTPARFKFLKTDATERANLVRTFEEIVFSGLNVTFRLELEKDKPILFPSQSSVPNDLEALRTRLGLAWGPRWIEGLVSVKAQAPHVSVHGWVTDQTNSQSSSRYQLFFVNHRPIQNRRLVRAIYDSFLGQLPVGRHPGWVLFLDVNPKAVDVNVHPTKREVKLAFESEIFGFLLDSVRNALQGNRPIFKSSSPMEKGFGDSVRLRREFEPAVSVPSFARVIDTLYQPLTPVGFEGASALETLPAGSVAVQEIIDFSSLPEGLLQARAQIRKTYIVTDTSEEVWLIDQHAAAERVLYEKLLASYTSASPAVQMLLIPSTWEVGLSLEESIHQQLPKLEKFGFHIEPFGKGTFVVKGYPACLGSAFDIGTLLEGLSDVFDESGDHATASEKQFEHRLAAMTACKASVRAGDALDLKSCNQLIQDWLKCQAPQTCPHGRPTVLKWPFVTLEKQFRRR